MIFKPLWVGRAGFGFVWRGTEHQFYRDLDGSMGQRWTHHTMPWFLECPIEWITREEAESMYGGIKIRTDEMVPPGHVELRDGDKLLLRRTF